VNNSLVKVRFSGLAVGGAIVGSVTDKEHPWFGMKGFVRDVIPGEDVVVTPTVKKDSYFEGEIHKFETISPHRRIPPCKYTSKCGGCDFQHINDEAQRNFKFEMLISALKSRNFPDNIQNKVLPLEFGNPFSCRRKVTLHFNKEGKVGFYARKSRNIIDLENCIMVDSVLTEIWSNIRSFVSEIKGHLNGTLIVESGNKEYVITCVVSEPVNKPKVKELICNVLKSKFIQSKLIIKGQEIWSSSNLKLSLQNFYEKEILLAPGNFSQVNSDINSKMVQYVIKYLEKCNITTAWDLYGGIGNFGIPLINKGVKVTLVEKDINLISTFVAYCNVNNNSHGAFPESVEKFLNRNTDLPDLIIADPPRSGLCSVVDKLPLATNIILVSCHLPAFLRDAINLIAKGYEIIEIKPFEMFPQTHFMEIVSIYRINKG
jgi:23S rRNA (uracil1939-C5)-methyltransferase